MGEIICDVQNLLMGIKQVIHTLKKQKDVLNSRQTYTSFVADKDYDVVVEIRLIKKKSQKQLGEDMFHGY